MNYCNSWNLHDRTVVLTGAAGHLGEAVSRALVAAGANVVGIGRNGTKLKRLAAELVKNKIETDGKFIALDGIDLRNTGTVTVALDAAGIGPVHALVNNAAIGRSGSFRLSSKEDFLFSLDMHVATLADVTQQCLPRLEEAAKKDGASIVNVASMYGRVSPDPRIYDDEAGRNPPAYGAAKAGVIQLSRYLACELAPSNIRTNTVSFGPFPAPSAPSNLVSRLADRVPLGRIGQPEEAAPPILFLCSPLSSYVNGADIAVDGGWTAW